MASCSTFCSCCCGLMLLLTAIQISYSNASQEATYPFQNVSLPWKTRVDDLVSRLTLEELVGQLAKGGTSPGGGPAPAIPRLGIKPYSWNTECLRGIGDAGPATSFPQAIGLAATFNRDILYLVAEATAKEARAKYANYSSHGVYGNHKGISCFSPVINIMRHPLWGRNQETYGEDPYLTAELSENFVHGLQGKDPRYIRANAGCKHFDVHGGPENIPVSRFSFDAKVTERDWRLTFLPAFYGCIVKGGSLSVMCSYNRINGVPACANKKLLTDILRKEWKFTGYVISDQDALENIVNQHKWKPTMEEAAAAAILAGTNLGLSSTNPKSTFTYLQIALQKKLVTFEQLQEAAKPLFYVRMRLGEFDPPSLNPYTKYNLSLIQSVEHREISLHAAMQSFVLLQNKHNLLPLQKKHFNAITIVGPMADNGDQLFGTYGATPDPKYVETPLTSLKKMADNVYFADGCSGTPKCSQYKADDVKAAVTKPDTQLIILCLGTDPELRGYAPEAWNNRANREQGDACPRWASEEDCLSQDNEAEGSDRSSLDLPGKQANLLQDVIANKGNVPVVLLLFSASPVILPAKDSLDAILECFFPAQSTGEAVRRILWNEGLGSNPAARLPYTWHASPSQVPSMVDYTMTNRTYRYWEMDSPAYPFGYGLSYSKFKYSNLKINNDNPKIGEDVTFSVNVTNTGSYHGDEVIQAYISWVRPPQPMPKLQLVAFERHSFDYKNDKGDTYQWKAKITASQMAVYFDEGGFKEIPGDILLFVGGQQPNQKISVDSNVLQGKITVTAK